MKKSLFLSALFCSGTAFAVCNPNINQTDLNICTMNEYKKADQELNKVYAAYTVKLDHTRKSQVKAVQLNWIKYKDSDCKYEASAYEGGSIQSLILNSCLTKKTKLRTQELKAYLAEENL
ncbi:lysozyme inhibitor LprI family protein [Acinetobacter sp. LoGeW2-3]|uniref:lysozyme inhibitor LprI family protein n=1 Tax=Acinetobacter sp. LoGeW2-3 TaxID=1808001 RepID=UPI00148A587A|nr:lysozyme inhibitor LprI family protein [Acinetobacter sp. LoGeW2-3]